MHQSLSAAVNPSASRARLSPGAKGSRPVTTSPPQSRQGRSLGNVSASRTPQPWSPQSGQCPQSAGSRFTIRGIMHVIRGVFGHDASPSVRPSMSRSKRSARCCWPSGLGVVVLGLQGGSELDAGLEEAAVLADRFVGAVELCWSGAAAVAEESVVFAAQPGHLRSDGVGGQRFGRRVEGVDLVGDREVLVGRRCGWRSWRSAGSCPCCGGRASRRSPLATCLG